MKQLFWNFLNHNLSINYICLYIYINSLHSMLNKKIPEFCGLTNSYICIINHVKLLKVNTNSLNSGSIFLRNCRQCAVAVSCQQFRIRDCENMEFMISCVTQPVIEASVCFCVQWIFNCIDLNKTLNVFVNL